MESCIQKCSAPEHKVTTESYQSKWPIVKTPLTVLETPICFKLGTDHLFTIHTDSNQLTVRWFYTGESLVDGQLYIQQHKHIPLVISENQVSVTPLESLQAMLPLTPHSLALGNDLYNTLPYTTNIAFIYSYPQTFHKDGKYELLESDGTVVCGTMLAFSDNMIFIDFGEYIEGVPLEDIRRMVSENDTTSESPVDGEAAERL